MKKIDLTKTKPVVVVRAVDKLGRILIPIEMRRCMGIETDDLVEQELLRDEDGELVIIIRKHQREVLYGRKETDGRRSY